MMAEVLGKGFINVLRTTYSSCVTPDTVEMAPALFAAEKVQQILWEKPRAGEMLLVEACKRCMAELIFRNGSIRRPNSFEYFNWVGKVKNIKDAIDLE